MRILGGWGAGALACVTALSCGSSEVAQQAGDGGSDAGTGGTGGMGGTEGGSGGQAGSGAGGSGAGGSSAYGCAEFLAEIDQLRADQGVTGMAVAIVQNGEVTCKQGFGNLDPSSPSKGLVKPSTLFLGEAIGPMLTTVAALQLADEGKLDLDTPIVSYVPDLTVDFDPNGWLGQVTVRHVLTRSSGFSSEGALPTATSSDDGLSDWATSADFRAGEFIQFPPGAVPQIWSTYAAMILGLVVERVGGIPFRTAVRQKILEPLGMTRTMYTSAEYGADTDLAGLTSGADSSALAPRIGPFASVEDGAKFLQFFMNGNTSVLSDERRVEAMAPQLSRRFYEDRCSYGFMWIVDDSICWDTHYDYGETTVYNIGSGFGSQTWLVMVPEKKSGFVMATVGVLNGPSLLEIQAALKLLGIQGPGPNPQAEDPSEFGKYVGTYQQPDVTVTVTLSGNTLHMKWGTTAHECDLLPGGYPSSVFKCNGAHVTFIPDANGEVRFLRSYDWVAEKTEPVDPDAGTGDAN